MGDLKDFCLEVLEGTATDGDGGAFLDARHMGTEGETLAPLNTDLYELLHQNIGDDGVDTVDVLVVVQAYASFVPVFLEHLVKLGLGSLDEDIPTQGTADLVVGLFVLRHGT